MEQIASKASVRRALEGGAVVVLTAHRWPEMVGAVVTPLAARSTDWLGRMEKASGEIVERLTMNYPASGATYTGVGWADETGARKLFPTVEAAREWVAANRQALDTATEASEAAEQTRSEAREAARVARLAEVEREHAARVAAFAETCADCGGAADYGCTMSNNKAESVHRCKPCKRAHMEEYTRKQDERSARDAERLAAFFDAIGLAEGQRTTELLDFHKGTWSATGRAFRNRSGGASYLPKGNRSKGWSLPPVELLTVKRKGVTVWDGAAWEWQRQGLDPEAARVAAALERLAVAS